MNWDEFKETEEGKSTLDRIYGERTEDKYRALFEAGQANSPDTARLDWRLDITNPALIQHPDGSWLIWGIEGDFESARAAIDAAMGEHDE